VLLLIVAEMQGCSAHLVDQTEIRVERERERGRDRLKKGSSAHPQSTGFNSLRVDSRSVHRLLSAALHIKDMNSGRTGTGKWETQRRWREEGVNRVGSILFLVSFFFLR